MLDKHTVERLLGDIQQGDEEALVVLHTHYAGMVYAVAYRVLGEGMAAEEVTQDTFLRLWEKADSYDPARGTFVPWLLTIARRRAIDRLGQRQRRQPPDGETFSLDSHQYLYELIPADDAHSEERHALAAALRELPEEQRTCLGLAYFYGLSHGDIAAHLGLPLGTVKTRLRLGMQKLRAAWLGGEGEAGGPAGRHPAAVKENQSRKA